MHNEAIRWPVFVPVSLLLAFILLAAEVFGLAPDFSGRPDLLWILAFVASMRTPPVGGLAGYLWCGLVRDMALGPKAGSASLAFLITGWIVLHWRPLLVIRGWPFHALACGIAATVVSAVKQALDLGWLARGLWGRVVVISLSDGALTMLFYVPFVIILSLPFLNPRRESDGLFA